MADNIRNNSRAIMSADEIAPDIFVQRVKLTAGVDGTATDVSATDPLPVSLTSGGALVGSNPLLYTAALVGASTATLDINTLLGRNASQLTLIHDGASGSDAEISLSYDGATYSNVIELKAGETFVFSDVDVDSVRITRPLAGADFSFRLVAQ